VLACLLLSHVHAFGGGAASGRGVSPRQAVSSMLSAITVEPSALACVESATQRRLIRGCCAISDDPQVLNSLSLLYEDLAVFRPAGNLLLRQLALASDQARKLYDELQDTGLKALDGALPSLRMAFDAIDIDGSGWLSEEELSQAAKSRELGATTQCAKLCLDAEECAIESDWRISFADFVSLVLADARGGAAYDANDEQRGVRAAATRRQQRQRERASARGGRFDGMLAEFLSWEATSTTSYSGRRAEIVTGCFAGARNEELVEAVRYVYVEDLVLRRASDVVFRMLRPPRPPPAKHL
jgi:hypothetical protein